MSKQNERHPSLSLAPSRRQKEIAVKRERSPSAPCTPPLSSSSSANLLRCQKARSSRSAILREHVAFVDCRASLTRSPRSCRFFSLAIYLYLSPSFSHALSPSFACAYTHGKKLFRPPARERAYAIHCRVNACSFSLSTHTRTHTLSLSLNLLGESIVRVYL